MSNIVTLRMMPQTLDVYFDSLAYSPIKATIPTKGTRQPANADQRQQYTTGATIARITMRYTSGAGDFVQFSACLGPTDWSSMLSRSAGKLDPGVCDWNMPGFVINNDFNEVRIFNCGLGGPGNQYSWLKLATSVLGTHEIGYTGSVVTYTGPLAYPYGAGSLGQPYQANFSGNHVFCDGYGSNAGIDSWGGVLIDPFAETVYSSFNGAAPAGTGSLNFGPYPIVNPTEYYPLPDTSSPGWTCRYSNYPNTDQAIYSKPCFSMLFARLVDNLGPGSTPAGAGNVIYMRTFPPITWVWPSDLPTNGPWMLGCLLPTGAIIYYSGLQSPVNPTLAALFDGTVRGYYVNLFAGLIYPLRFHANDPAIFAFANEGGVTSPSTYAAFYSFVYGYDGLYYVQHAGNVTTGAEPNLSESATPATGCAAMNIARADFLPPAAPAVRISPFNLSRHYNATDTIDYFNEGS